MSKSTQPKGAKIGENERKNANNLVLTFVLWTTKWKLINGSRRGHSVLAQPRISTHKISTHKISKDKARKWTTLIATTKLTMISNECHARILNGSFPGRARIEGLDQRMSVRGVLSQKTQGFAIAQHSDYYHATMSTLKTTSEKELNFESWPWQKNISKWNCTCCGANTAIVNVFIPPLFSLHMLYSLQHFSFWCCSFDAEFSITCSVLIKKPSTIVWFLVEKHHLFCALISGCCNKHIGWP